ncbi:RagB/SusD family nutrient uptake outer membrane protein [Paraflavitalea sp. CAU 1676]|uniref:RagB/SusD family nutrient uptake outer membrane protein n=1 Tax=Paraflavitalea sp. CAU 1676 TaxID=3032598 RepID=UPI0023DC1AE4|nr:RagB/SusD family nutrient uptake outer membrane protein [Paraflavitalea sp. CAU 1676]MDF2192263.1 RagB/SusD family nutrient uptake outer membrane protein [Paraflavitalea sp. CAU 1676]
MKRQLSLLYIGALLLAVVTGSGCKKEFITDPKPTDAVSEDDVFKSVSGVRSYFSGIYRNMRRQWSNLDNTAGGATDTWGYNSINLARINKGTDIINPGGFYQFDYRHENREPTYRRTIFTWGFFYEHINQANVIIKGVTASTLPAADKKLLEAEARAIRAWFYFDLIREFQHTIAKDANAPGVPLYTEPTGLENEGKPRGTIKEVYDLINADIEFATQSLGTGRLVKSDININVAWGMAARIYLEQRRWADAKNAAQKARAGYSLDAASYANGFSDLGSPEVIWGFPQATDIGGQSLYYGTPSSFYEKTGNGYDNLFVNSSLVASFAPTDVRNLFFLTSGNPNSAQRFSTNKFGSAIAEEVELITGEVVPLKATFFNEALPMIRVAEMYLVEAEAKAELNEADAGVPLLAVQKSRDASATASGNTGAALITEILLERRKEFYGELGLDYLDVKRRQLPLVRTGNHPAAYRFTIPANDNRFIMKIPQKEFDSNKKLNPATDQNG